MSHLNLAWLETYLQEVKEHHAKHPTAPAYARCETGPYKPYHKRTIDAAKRKGYKVEAHCHDTVFYVYPK